MDTFSHYQNIKTVDDLLSLLNEAKIEIYGDTAKPFNEKQLRYHRYSTLNPKRYVTFKIPKKKQGEFREIAAPCDGLKSIQKCLCLILSKSFTPNESATGFVQGKSIVDNAKKHIKRSFVFNIDLKDFFPSITSGRVWKRLQSKPFEFPPNMASVISDLCCHHGVLPQGAPTSPIITNIVCERLDRKLTALSRKYKVHYSRYADDISFSAQSNLFHEDGQFLQSVYSVITGEGFVVNSDKTHLRSLYERQEVTGIKVNSKLNVSAKYVKPIRTMLKNWEIGGYDYAQQIFLANYHPTKYRRVKCEHHIENILDGKIEYLRMVKGKDDSTYLKLKSRFDKLTGKSDTHIKTEEEKQTDTLLDSLIKNLSDIIKT